MESVHAVGAHNLSVGQKKNMNASPGIYVHIPFCVSRCAYCGFASGIYNSALADRYLDALALETAGHADLSPSSVFIGGGTPSCLPASQLKRMLGILPPWRPEAEATVELNPDSVDAEKLALLRESGVNRCSFGVQTFDPFGLSLLERRHNADQAIRAVKLARGAGFQQINIDLIAGWPGQDRDALIQDCRQAIELETTHISVYMLIPDENTEFTNKVANRGLRFQSERASRETWDMVEAIMSESFIHYEVSNYAKPGCECRHNVAAWKGGEYYGFGAAAHSHVRGIRSANVDSAEEYCGRILSGDSAVAFSEALPPMEKARETAVMWLRLTEGIHVAEYAGRTGFTLEEVYPAALPSLIQRGMLEWNGKRTNVRVTREWRPFLDTILVELV